MCVSFLYAYITGDGEKIDMTNEMSAIIAALITASASFFVWLGSERKGTRTVKEKLEEIGSDTKAVPQKADSIKADTEAIRRNVTETVIPRLDTATDIADGVKALVADLNYRKGMMSESSVRTQEALKAGMDAVFEENARLSQTVREQAEEIGALKAKNQELAAKNLSLEKQLSGYKKQERSRWDIARDER